LGEAITGQATVDFSSDADVTITLTDAATTQAARNLRLNITESSSGIGSVRNLILGSGCQIEKFYLINNTGTGAKTVKNTSGTGISVPAGKATLVFNNGTNVVDAASYFTSLTLGSALPIASGGTGSTSTTFVNLATNVTGTLPVGNGGTGITSFGSGVATFLGTPSSANLAAALTDETGSGSAVFATSPTLVTPILGTPQSATLTNATGLPISSGVSGLGTNVATALAVSVGSAGAPVVNGGVLGTPSSGTLTNTTGLPLTTGVTGTLPVANGGTGLSTTTEYSVVFAGTTATGPFQASAGPGTATHVLTSNGAGALPTFQAPAPSGITAGKSIAFALIFGL
jgi:hypothetical protein